VAAADTVRVLHGTPDDVELAALVVALMASRTTEVRVPQPRAAWSDPAWHHGAGLRPRRGAWRMSGLPR
jgi:hypothetical protein